MKRLKDWGKIDFDMEKKVYRELVSEGCMEDLICWKKSRIFEISDILQFVGTPRELSFDVSASSVGRESAPPPLYIIIP